MAIEENPSPGGLPADAEDVRLMGLIGKGDTEALEHLIERHQSLVLGTVGRMLGNIGDAEDIAQQVFIRVWKSAARYTPSAKFTTWLLKITRNLVFNEMRRRKRHALLPLQANAEGDERPLPDDRASTPDVSLLEAELEAAIQWAIGELSDSQRMAVILRRYEDMSYEQIADVLDQSVPAVKSLLFRARTELRVMLARYLSG